MDIRRPGAFRRAAALAGALALGVTVTARADDVRGIPVGAAVSAVSAVSAASDAGRSVRASAAAQGAPPRRVVGVHDVEVVRLVPAGLKADPQMSEEAVARAVASASAYWAEQTAGRVTFRMTSITPWISTRRGCDDVQGLWDDAERATDAAPGTHVMVVVPASAAGAPGCDLGFASMGEGDGGTTYVAALYAPLLAHELGHNLGLAHAGTLECRGAQDARYDDGWPQGCGVREYDDLYDVMGYSGQGYGGGYLGSVGEAALGMGTASSVTLTASRRVRLVPYARPEGIRTLRVEVPGEPAYYAEYRTGAGRDASIAGGPWSPSTGVRILRENPETHGSLELDATPGGWRYDRALPVGSTFTSASGRVRITLRASDAAGADLAVTVADS